MTSVEENHVKSNRLEVDYVHPSIKSGLMKFEDSY